MSYNNFGATTTSVAHYLGVSGCQSAADVITQFTSDVIETFMEDVVQEIVGNMCYTTRDLINEVELEQLNRDGGIKDNVSTLTLGLSPVSSVYDVWIFGARPAMRPNTRNALEIDDFTVSITSGVATLTYNHGDYWPEGSYVYATYQLDTDSTDYNFNSLKSMVHLGVAARLWTIHSDDDTWGHLKNIAGLYQTALKRIRDCSWLPNELRALRFYSDPDQSKVSSVYVFRG